MKNLILIGVFALLSAASAVAQVEVSDNDTTATSQITRAATKYYSGIAYRVQRGKAPRRIGFYDEIVAASAGGVQQVNNVSPTGGNVNITFANLLSKPNTVSGFGITDAVATGGSYSNPTWLTALAYSKLTGVPTTISGFGITDGVSTGGSYANPTWLTGLAFPKLTGLPSTLLGYGITDAALAVNVIPLTPVASYAAIAGVAAPAAGFIKFVKVATDARYTESNTLYILDENGKYRKVSLLPSEN